MSPPETATGTAVRTRGLTKRYGSGETAFLALKGVDIEIAEGEVVFISGPSGSGKTTLLSILGCGLSPTDGEVSVLGRDITKMSERKLADFRLNSMGFIFQGFNLIASQDALGNVKLPQMLRGISSGAAARLAAEELETVGIGDKISRLPRDLSGGQRQRVAIARATVGRPPLILADEPTASLDASSGRDVMELLTRMARERRTTVVVVTHDNRIYHYADRLIAIEDGQLVKEVT